MTPGNPGEPWKILENKLPLGKYLEPLETAVITEEEVSKNPCEKNQK